MVTTDPSSNDSVRAAGDTIRGFVTQMYWTIERWLELRAEESLVCEGHEDVDLWLFDEEGRFVSVHEQMKDIRSGRISVRTADVHETVFNFLLAFVDSHARQKSVRFVFTTSAAFARQQLSTKGEGGDLAIDVLREWQLLPDSQESSKSVASLRDAVAEVIDYYGAEERAEGDSKPPARHARSKLRQALSYMDERGVWEEFLRSVEWRPEQLAGDELIVHLEKQLQGDSRVNALPTGLLLPRLLATALHTSSRKNPEQRVLGPADLDDVFSETHDQLQEWVHIHRGPLISPWLSELQGRVDVLTEEVAHLRQTTTSLTNRSSEGDSVEFLATWLRAAALEDDRVLGFIGFPPDIESTPRVELSRVFVAPMFTRRDPTGGVLEFDALVASCVGGEEQALRAVILGDPGSGKSTLCRMLALRTAQRELSSVPLLLRLRLHEIGEDDVELSLLGMVAGQLSRRSSKVVEEGTLAQLCKQGQALLLIDGLDEPADASRERLRERLHGFARSYAKTPIVVTSRPAGYDRLPLDARFQTVHLEPFDPERLRVFIERWFEVAIPDDPDERSRVRARLNATLDAQPQSRALAGNPLLATLIMLVYRENGHLPTRRVELYRLCVELLVRDWPEKWGRAMPELSGDWQIDRLGVLALWMQETRSDSPETSGVLVYRSILDENLAKILACKLDPRVVQQKRGVAARWRRWLTDSKVLQEDDPQLYGFVHLSLMEYLAGRRLYDTLGADTQQVSDYVAKRRIKSSWHETLLMMLGIANDRALCSKVVARLLSEQRADADARFFLSLLRDDLDIDEPLRRELLSAVAGYIGDHSFSIRPRHAAYASLVSDIIEFGRRHGAPVRRWLVDEARRCRGRELVGILVMMPASLELDLEELALEPKDMARLLELGEDEPWGCRALETAKPADLLCWSTSAPVSHLLGHALRTGVVRKDAAASWVLGVLRRLTWLSVKLSRARKVGDTSEAIEWQSGGVRMTIASSPAVVATMGDLCDHGIWVKSVRSLDISEGDAALHVVLAIQLANSGLFRRFARFIQGSYVYANVGQFFNERRKPAAADNSVELLNFARFRRAIGDDAVDPSVVLISSLCPARTPPNTRSAPPWCPAEEKAHAWAMITAVFASFHGGMTTHQDEDEFDRVTGTMRVQNLWLNVFFDLLVDHVAHETKATPTTLTAEHHALLLALGLAQYQTTWHWPFSKHWHEWFTGRTPPEHWLPAYIWHLCWAVGEPSDATHLKRAEACLSGNDWPALAAALREFAIVPASEQASAGCTSDEERPVS